MKKQENTKSAIRIATLAFIVFAGMQGIAKAQEIDFGVRAGALYSLPTYGNNVSNDQAQFGGQVGLFARTSGKLYLQPELSLSVYKASYQLTQRSFKPTFYQLNLPIQVGYTLYEKDATKLRGALGPQLNYQLKKERATPTNNFKSFTYDAMVNVGADLGKYTLDVRYNHGLNNSSNELDSRNRVVGLSVGYKF